MEVSKAVIYTRISQDRDDESSIEAQQRSTRLYAEQHGWEVVAVETDRGRSAFKSDSRRPALNRALTLIERGAADVLIVWKLDRLARSVRDFTLIDERLLAADAAFVSVTDGFDTSTAMGRAMRQIAAVFAELESGIKSERIDSWHGERRNKLLPPPGPRPYGYDRIKGDEGLRVVADEAAVITEMAERVLDGASIRSLTNDLNARGLRTRSGARWGNNTLRRVLLNPVTSGRLNIDGEWIIGCWEPALDVDTADRVRELFTDPSRRTVSSNARRHLLAGMIACGTDSCDSRLGSKARRSTGNRYVCPKCGNGANADAVETIVRDSLLAAIDSEAWQALKRRGTAPSVDLDRIDEELNELAAMFAAGDLSFAEWRTMREGITRRMAEADAEPAELPDIDDLGARWALHCSSDGATNHDRATGRLARSSSVRSCAN